MKNKLLFFISAVFFSQLLQAQTEVQPNILFVISDDLNDYVNTLYDSHPQSETPNIAALASMGTVFQNAFCNSPLCAPSRTSFLTGKLPDYTGVTINGMFNCSDFNANITPGNYIMPLPQYLKDSAGYFTYNLGKIYHCAANEYDAATADPCTRGKSWNLLYNTGNDAISNAGQANPQGISEIKWSRIDSSLTPFMDDYIAADSIIAFFNRYANDPSEFCDKPFFMAYGIKKPHSNLYIPSQYFLDYYIDDYYETPYVIPYNQPYNAYPYNGFVMPPQPAIPYSDIDSLGELANEQMPFAAHNQMNSWYTSLSPLPEIDGSLTLTERQNILTESKRANGTMAYMAAVKFVDEQFGRVMDALAEKPELYSNTIVIFVSDHGFSWGEKKHYGKAQLYETDIRIPLIIADLRSPVANVTQRTVSLIDLYPTICAFAGITPPVFPDGTPYLDGKNLIPLMQNPNLQIESPALIQISNAVNGLACFPQSSIRNENWHYIRFISNGAVDADFCDSANAYTERILYNIGSNRNYDKNEWNNLGSQPEYSSLMDYFDMLLPGGELFNQPLFKVTIMGKTLKCLYKNTDTIFLKSKLYNTSGGLVSGASLSNYTFKWTNSLTTETYLGSNYNFLMSTLTASQYASNSKIVFNLEVTENSTGNIKAFEIFEAQINPLNKPNAMFDVSTEGLTATIVDYTLTGEYNTTSWNFGDGFTTIDLIPAPHTYLTSGSYSIRNIINYGNNCKRTIRKNIVITSADGLYTSRYGESDFSVYPNPADNYFTVQFQNGLLNCEVRMYNLTGQLVFMKKFDGVSTNKIIINAGDLPQGVYTVELRNDTFTESQLIEIL